MYDPEWRALESDAQLAAIGAGLIAHTLPKPRWKHEAHLAAAAWIIAARPDLDAARDMPGIIRAYNTAMGTPNSDTRGYHDTITQASLRGIRAFLAAQLGGVALYEQVNRLIASPLGSKTWLLDHWSEAVLFTPAARAGWIAPDKAPLPF